MNDEMWSATRVLVWSALLTLLIAVPAAAQPTITASTVADGYEAAGAQDGDRFCLRVEDFPIYAAQFHIEMDGTPDNSRRIMANFLKEAKEWSARH